MTNTAEVTAATKSAAPERAGWSAGQIVGVLVIGTAALMVSLTQSLLVPVLSKIAVDLKADGDGIAWVLTSTLLVGAVAVPTFGRLGDLFGTRRMLLVTLGALIA